MVPRQYALLGMRQWHSRTSNQAACIGLQNARIATVPELRFVFIFIGLLYYFLRFVHLILLYSLRQSHGALFRRMGPLM